MKKRKKIKWKNVLLACFLFCFLFVFLISLYKVVYHLQEKKKNQTLIEELQTLDLVKENKEIEKEKINKQLETVSDTIDYYYEYIKVPFIEIDFSSLKEKNKEVSGWIQVLGTKINYPYLQTSDNEYYLSHSFDKSKNSGGWVFLDYRNQKQLLDKNTILYAHGVSSSALFGPLKEIYDKKDWYNDKENHYIKIATEDFSYVFKVFSLYKIETTSDYLEIEFSDDSSYKSFLDKIKNRSVYDFETSVLTSDKMITLSTCYNKKEKVVLHGKLIKEKEI